MHKLRLIIDKNVTKFIIMPTTTFKKEQRLHELNVLLTNVQSYKTSNLKVQKLFHTTCMGYKSMQI